MTKAYELFPNQLDDIPMIIILILLCFNKKV